MEKPKITKINDKESTVNYIEYQEIKNADSEKDKYVLPLVMPRIEEIADRETIYNKALKQEIELFKKEIDYDGICEEQRQDMAARGCKT